MRFLLLGAILPLLAFSAPDADPRITALTVSGSGCPNSSGSVKTPATYLGDSATFYFNLFSGDDTDNCEIHLTSSGGSSGWQAAVYSVYYTGYVTLTAGSELDTVTTVFWSADAADTSVLHGSLVAATSPIKQTVTIGSSTTDYAWSACEGSDGSPGILNVDFRPVINGNSGTYNITSATWNLIWRKC